MNNFTQKRCAPCEGESEGLSEEQVSEHLQNADVSGWGLENNSGAIEKQFTFDDFRQAIDFVNQVADVAEEQQHHPDITINYNKVTLDLKTHSINALSENDFIVAAKVNALLG